MVYKYHKCFGLNHYECLRNLRALGLHTNRTSVKYCSLVSLSYVNETVYAVVNLCTTFLRPNYLITVWDAELHMCPARNHTALARQATQWE